MGTPSLRSFLKFAILSTAILTQPAYAQLSGTTDSDAQLPILRLGKPVPAQMRASSGLVLRGHVVAMSPTMVQFVASNSAARNPEGVQLEFAKIKSLNIGPTRMTWKSGQDSRQFVLDYFEKHKLLFLNRDAFETALKQSQALKDGTTQIDSVELQNGSPSLDSGEIRVMQPSKNADGTTIPTGSTITTICGNCKETVHLVTGNEQVCPHCGIKWANSVDTAIDADSTEGQQLLANDGNSNLEVTPLKANPLALGPQQNVQQIVPAQPNLAPTQSVAGGPVVVPAPMVANSGPQEITLENLPVWMKAAIFLGCLFAMYYVFFHLR